MKRNPLRNLYAKSDFGFRISDFGEDFLSSPKSEIRNPKSDLAQRFRRGFLLAACFSVMTCLGQIKHPAYGGYADYALNIHSANFQQLPGVPSCCPLYGNGTGSGFAVGGEFRAPIAGRLDVQLRAGYQSQNALLSTTQATTVLQNGTSGDGELEYRLDGTLANIGAEAMAGLKIIDDAFRVMGGMRAGYVVEHRYSQIEQIIQPSNGATFVNNGVDTHSRTRNAYTGEIPGASAMQLDAVIGFSYDLPANPQETIFLVPELTYSYALTNVATDLNWRANAIRLGVSVLYSPVPQPMRMNGGRGN